MSIIGKLVSNVREFYRDINSATLTGAIDVVIIQKADGTYVSSPFHVRFGKLGVLRAREKVVDIEVNDEPVDLHMKLGEAGEAFFVREAEDEYELPPHLATSPLPDASQLMEEGIMNLHKELFHSKSEGVACDTITTPEALWEPCGDADSDTSKEVAALTPDDDTCSAVVPRDTSMKSLYFSSDDLTSTTATRKRSLDIAIQTDLTGNEVESKRNYCMRVISPPPCASNLPTTTTANTGETDDKNVDSLPTTSTTITGETDDKNDTSAMPSGEKNTTISTNVTDDKNGASAMPSGEKNTTINTNETDDKNDTSAMPSAETSMTQLSKDVSAKLVNDIRSATNVTVNSNIKLHTTSTDSERNKDSSSDSPCNKCSLDADATKTGGAKSKRRRRKKLNALTKPLNQTTESALVSVTKPSGVAPMDVGECDDEGVFQLELTEDDVATDRVDDCARSHSAAASTTTLTDIQCQDVKPTIEEKLRLTDEWADNQFAAGLHPFSDGDITPVMSPVGSRPPSPKSDTEYETRKYDAVSQTQLTGDDLRQSDNYRWEWGELPESSCSVAQEGAGAAKTEGDVKTESSDSKAVNDRASSGLFHFMRKTKKLRHQPELEGIYLDDLNLNEMDPEVAALYLYHSKNGSSVTVQDLKQELKDEDSESGKGASLPHSPETVQHKESQQDTEVSSPEVELNSVSTMAMSLCGGLLESGGDISTERFLQFLVTYDDFCEKPNVLSDPNLVVRIDGKYYNWHIAGPVVMSMLAFERPLPEATVDSLTKQHMPKKERRRGWFSWGRTPAVPQESNSSLSAGSPQPGTSAEKKDDDDSTTCSPSSSPPNSPRKSCDKTGAPRDDGFQSDEDSETLVAGMASEHTQTSSEKYKKCLKLTTDQILQMRLKEGVNEVSFSVTTQYQGTTRCTSSIFLWRWDDRVIVSDIDGTITRSDVLGQVLPMIGKDWSQAGIAKLYSMVARNGYKFLYLSSRAIGQAKTTRDYLRSVCQAGNVSLPDGPLLLSPSSLISAFHKEVIERKPEEFKISCLRDIQALFPPSRNPFYAGFGNKINDVWAYRAVGIPISRVFTVNYKGELKLELIQAHHSSYTKLGDIVDHVFPPLLDRHGKITSGNFPLPDEYSPFTYWRDPLPDINTDELGVFLGRSPEVAVGSDKK